jgi:plasmid stabilization system protein ParE
MSEFRASPAIVGELDDAIKWYASRSPEAARRFIEGVETAIDRICKCPERFPWRSTRCQYARVKKYPYIIAFSAQGGVITIAAIRHTSRRNEDLDD